MMNFHCTICTGQENDVKAAIKWGTDYMLRAHAADMLLYAQVNELNAIIWK